MGLNTFKKITPKAAADITLGIMNIVLRIFQPFLLRDSINAVMVPIPTWIIDWSKAHIPVFFNA
ncbi:hypothetical protein LBYZC6_06210 [Lacrimispora brassicae]